MRKEIKCEMLSIPEISQMYGVTGSGIRADIRNGKLPAVRIGRQFRVKQSDLDNYIQHYGNTETEAKGTIENE